MKHVLLLLVAALACEKPRAAIRDAAPPPSSPRAVQERVVLDLVANRPRAHLSLDGALVLDGGAPGFWKYVDGGWKSSWLAAARDGQRRAAILTQLAGVVRVPLPVPGDYKVVFTLRPGVPQQALTLFFNGKSIANLAVEDGWHSYEATLPAALVKRGENTLRFHFRALGTIGDKRAAAAVERIVIGPRARDSGPPPRLGEPYGLAGDVRRALAASTAAAFSYDLVLPKSGPLRLRAAVGSQSAPARAEVRIARDEPPDPVVVWRGEAGGTWQELEVDLATFLGDAARIELVLDGGGAFAEPRLTTDPSSERAESKSADHVIVWMVDTLRADKLKMYDKKSPLPTPAFDLLAEEGARFTSATVQGNYSLPSHASILTGCYPSVHGMLEDTSRLAATVPYVAERMKAGGRATALFSSNGYVSEKWGFRRGFDAYRNFIRENLPSSAFELWKAARPWLESQVKLNKKTFMYLVTIEPHVAYDPQPDFLRRTFPRAYNGPIKPKQTNEQLFKIKTGKLPLSTVDKQFLEALYDAEILQDDAALARVVEDLRALGIWERTAIVLVSDHGDEFWEHGSVGHGHSVWQELVDVPLLVRFPGRVPTGSVVEADVEALDVAPTLLELAGLEPSPEMQGLSVLGLLGGVRMPRPAFSQHGTMLRGMRLGRFKLVTSSARTGLYDLERDPHEQTSLVEARPIAMQAMRAAFALHHAYEARWRKPLWGVASDLKPAFADELDR